MTEYSKLALAFIGFFYVLLLFRTVTLEWTTNQSLFSAGADVATLPDGDYNGQVEGPQFSWLGKQFNASSLTGINRFTDSRGTIIHAYPFKMYTGEGVHDKREVISVDYDVPNNPFWLRPCLDELVETSPGHYLGKLHIRIFPGYPFTLLYFRLEKVTP